MSRRNRARVPILITCLAIIVAACNSSDDTAATVPEGVPSSAAATTQGPEADLSFDLAGTRWIVESMLIDGEVVVPDGVTLQFSEDRVGVGGSSGCNVYGGAFSLTDNELRFADLFTTAKLCGGEDVMAHEELYSDLLVGPLYVSMYENYLQFEAGSNGDVVRFIPMPADS